VALHSVSTVAPGIHILLLASGYIWLNWPARDAAPARHPAHKPVATMRPVSRACTATAVQRMASHPVCTATRAAHGIPSSMHSHPCSAWHPIQYAQVFPKQLCSGMHPRLMRLVPGWKLEHRCRARRLSSSLLRVADVESDLGAMKPARSVCNFRLPTDRSLCGTSLSSPADHLPRPSIRQAAQAAAASTHKTSCSAACAGRRRLQTRAACSESGVLAGALTLPVHSTCCGTAPAAAGKPARDLENEQQGSSVLGMLAAWLPAWAAPAGAQVGKRARQLTPQQREYLRRAQLREQVRLTVHVCMCARVRVCMCAAQTVHACS